MSKVLLYYATYAIPRVCIEAGVVTMFGVVRRLHALLTVVATLGVARTRPQVSST